MTGVYEDILKDYWWLLLFLGGAVTVAKVLENGFCIPYLVGELCVGTLPYKGWLPYRILTASYVLIMAGIIGFIYKKEEKEYIGV